MKVKKTKTNFYAVNLVMIAVLLICSSVMGLYAQADIALGDVNEDSVIDIIDALLIAQAYVDLDPDNYNPDFADVNCDDEIDIIDALLVAQLYVDLIPPFDDCPGETSVPTATPVVTDIPTIAPTGAPAGDLKVQYKCAETAVSVQQIKPHLNIINTGSTSVALSELTVRYYFTKEGSASAEFNIDYTGLGSGNVTSTFTDTYLEIGFTAGAGTLAASGQTGEIQCRINKSDWTPFDQSDDFSFDPTKTSFADFDKITLYQNGTIVWGHGYVPGTPEPTAVPTETPVVTATPVPTLTPVPTATPDPGDPNAIIIEVEDFVDYYDLDGSNNGKKYRPNEGVDIEDCYFGGFNICWVQANEWLEFDIDVANTGTYNIWVRVSSGDTQAGKSHIEIDATDVTGPISVSPTGDWQAWKSLQAASGVSISAGSHTVRLSIDAVGNNFDYIYITNTTGPPPNRTPPPAPMGYVKPVDTYGHLQLVGNNLCDKNGDPAQLRGMSSHDIRWHWFGKDHTVQNLAYGWGASLIRAAMYTSPDNGGYISNPVLMKERVKDIVDDAIEAGIYVIVDWHILKDNNPNTYTNQSKSFFDEMSEEYGSYPNLIWEICNEPNGVNWSQIKSYAEQVVPVIRANDPDNIIIVGTPNWSQDVDIASNDPVSGSNIMYALHFYAGTHTGWLRDKANTALSNGIGIFVTEYGTCQASGTGGFNFSEAQLWMNWMASNNISWANWSLANKLESASALKEATGISGPWSDADCTETGRWVKDRL